VIEELISASMIEKNRHQVANFGTTAFRQLQAAQPGLDFDCLHIAEFVVAPLWNNSTPQVDRIAILRGVAAPSVRASQFALLEMIAQLRNCDRIGGGAPIRRIYFFNDVCH
jgi:hypothetical protein